MLRTAGRRCGTQLCNKHRCSSGHSFTAFLLTKHASARIRGTAPAADQQLVRPLRCPYRPQRRPFPHPPSTPPHDGHDSSPPASCRSTSSRSPFTVSTTPPRVTQRPSPGASPKDHGEGRTTTDPLTVPPSPAPPATPATANPPAGPSARCRRRRTLAPAQASPPHIGIPNAAKTPRHRNPERRSTRHTRGVTYDEEWTLTLTAAQVHATLALAAASAVDTTGPDGRAWADVAATRLSTSKPEAPSGRNLTCPSCGAGRPPSPRSCTSCATPRSAASTGSSATALSPPATTTRRPLRSHGLHRRHV